MDLKSHRKVKDQKTDRHIGGVGSIGVRLRDSRADSHKCDSSSGSKPKMTPVFQKITRGQDPSGHIHQKERKKDRLRILSGDREMQSVDHKLEQTEAHGDVYEGQCAESIDFLGETDLTGACVKDHEYDREKTAVDRRKLGQIRRKNQRRRKCRTFKEVPSF